MIIRTPNRERYVIISKVPLEDARLSWKARGLLSYLLSKPDEWKVVINHLIEQAPDGEESVRSGLKELEEAGYIRRERARGGGGKFDSVNTEVFEEPGVFPDETTSGFSRRGFSRRGKSGSNEYMNIMNNESKETNTVSEKSSKKTEKFIEEFEEIWAIYPRRVNKKETYKKYVATRARGVPFEVLIHAAKEYAARQVGQEERFTLHGSTFFGPNERWRDFCSTVEKYQVPESEMESAIAYDLYDSGEEWCHNGENTSDNPAKFGIQRVVDNRGNLVDALGRVYELDSASGRRRYVV